jgi:low affinity Fe/Cu permease
MMPARSTSRFVRFAKAASKYTGRPAAFFAAAGTIVLWAAAGPAFGFSNTWQLVVNTGTTIMTFLMVFLIQNTQNRDSEAIQIKLDEVIRAVPGANAELLDLEELDDADLDRLRDEYEALAQRARAEANRRQRPLQDVK